jgi:predicted dienelactone hydrolase
MQDRMGGVLLAATLCAVIMGVGCGGGSSSTPPPADIIVAVTPAQSQVEEGSKVSLSATVSNDSSGKGVTWNLSPTSGEGRLTNITPTSAQYNAPTTPLSGDEAVKITAAAVADPSRTAVARVTVNAILVTTTAATSTVTAGSSTMVTALVQNDPENRGVTWSISPATGGGTISNPTATAVLYTAPSTPPPSDVPVTVIATSVSDPTKSSPTAITFAAIVVSVVSDVSTLEATGKAHLTATVTGDPANQGVTWSLVPPSGVGTLSNATSTSVTYAAPSTIPTGDIGATVVGTSVTTPTITGSQDITVAAIQVALTPLSGLIPVGASQEFTPTVQFDPTNKGVQWTLQQNGAACSSGCGTVTPTHTLSGTATTYTAPLSVPANPAATVMLSSSADATKTATATVTVIIGTVKLVPASLNFGVIKINGSKTLPLALTNTGASVLHISNLTFGAGPFTQTDDCGTSVAAGATCTIQITCAPKVSGTFNTNISIADDSAGSPQLVPIKVIATARFRFGTQLVRTLVARSIVAAPRPTGPQTVGTRELVLTEASHQDPYLHNRTPRELMVRFWYPAESAAACRKAVYSSVHVWSYLSQLSGLPLPQVLTNSCQDATVAAGRHPVAVITHGYTGTFTDYTFLAEDLASRGYIVASVNHTYESTAVAFPDGRLAKSAFGSHLGPQLREDSDAITFAARVRLADLSLVLDELQRMGIQRNSPFRGRFDMNRVALVGHSLGGFTTILGVQAEPRFRAGVVLDGMVPSELGDKTATPLLVVNAGKDAWGDDECRLWNHLAGERTVINLAGAEHVALSDAVWLAHGAIKTGTMRPDSAVAAVRDYVAAFLDHNLRGARLNPLLSGPSARYPQADITTRNNSHCMATVGTAKNP